MKSDGDTTTAYDSRGKRQNDKPCTPKRVACTSDKSLFPIFSIRAQLLHNELHHSCNEPVQSIGIATSLRSPKSTKYRGRI
eukprot:1039837-Pyramimonas_sp.AAC.1